jgi:hypothetical protein
MLKHLDDDGDLSLFITTEGEIALVCSKGHQWLGPARFVLGGGPARLGGEASDRAVIEKVREQYPTVFGNGTAAQGMR